MKWLPGMFVVDTNILLYAADPSFSGHTRCRKLLKGWRRRRRPWHTTWHILYEFIRLSTHPQIFPEPWAADQAFAHVQELLSSPGLDLLVETDRHSQVIEQLLSELPFLQGNLVHDARTAILMKEHGVRQIYTRDADFHRFPWVEVVDPLD